MQQLIINGDLGGPTFIFAHGAGAGMDSDFMTRVATGLAERGIRVIRFEFPYMQKQRDTGKRRPPDRQPKLTDHFKQIIEQVNLSRVVIGGKSMGGRMATVLASEKVYDGVVVLGYPFHALGKPEKVRMDHFQTLESPVLICQGERDSMGSRADTAQYRLPDNIEIDWFADGDHDLKPRKASGFTHAAHLDNAIERVSQFIHQMSAD
ncbi:alpha/beta fold hydrolase [Reinekea sp.]|uniref:alpha/beta fold hydrolase n=1 Tax=Reinekea sp. TaxID=1970455 RepID=UPI002A827BE7|nr:alpha/beta fold hydrolase [Reinekea sp.]